MTKEKRKKLEEMIKRIERGEPKDTTMYHALRESLKREKERIKRNKIDTKAYGQLLEVDDELARKIMERE